MRIKGGSLRKESGFTLIEILTVLMLIGIVMGSVIVFISQRSPEEDMGKAVERFVVISDHVSELSVLAGEPVGLMVTPPEWRQDPLEQGWRYSWRKMTDQGWLSLPNVPAVELPKEFRLTIFIDEIEWEYEKAPKEMVPIVAFYPSGEVTPFEIEFSNDEVPGQIETVLVDLWGKVIWKERQEELERRKEQEL